MQQQKINDNKFVDYQHSKMLKELGFNGECFAWYGRKFPQMNWGNLYVEQFIGAGDFSCYAPLWQDAEEWLWGKYKIGISVTWKNDNEFNSPVTARIESIKDAIKHLHEQLKK